MTYSKYDNTENDVLKIRQYRENDLLKIRQHTENDLLKNQQDKLGRVEEEGLERKRLGGREGKRERREREREE